MSCMGKTDDFIKSEIDTIKTKNLEKRRFIGNSNMDQKLWIDGGLTFGYNGFKYGSLDFAFYKENEKWIDPLTNEETKKRPIVVIEGSDCLNTRSWGNAQIQRFHHIYGGFLAGLCSIYYLRKGEHSIKPELFGVASHLNQKYRKEKSLAALLIIDDFAQLKNLIEVIDEYGAPSEEYIKVIDEINKEMEKRFLFFFKKFNGWEDYLESRAIIKYFDGTFIKYLGPKKRSLLDSSQRMGHIVIGEAFVSRFLLERSNLFRIGTDFFYYFFPLLTKREIEEIDAKLRHDKEWRLLRKRDNPWRLVTMDCISGIENRIRDLIQNKFRMANLNECKGEWNKCKKYIANKLKNGEYKITSYIPPKQYPTYMRLPV